jgi:hypothetical protein
MTLSKLAPALAAIALLGACEARIGNDAAPIDANATAENRAEEGRLTIEAPGFNLQMDIPDSMMNHAEMNGDNALFYPGARFGGIHVQGGREEGAQEGVELRFSTGDEIARVVSWYRDSARATEFTIASATAEGSGFVIAGTDREDGDPFTLHIAPRASGGTEARLFLTDRN